MSTLSDDGPSWLVQLRDQLDELGGPIWLSFPHHDPLDPQDLTPERDVERIRELWRENGRTSDA